MIVSEGYTLQVGAREELCVVGAQILAVRITFANASSDRMEISRRELIDDPAMASVGDWIILRERGVDSNTSEEWVDVLFSGFLRRIQVDSVSGVVSYLVSNLWTDLEHIVYETPSDGTPEGFARSHITLGRQDDTPRTLETEISAAFDYASAFLPSLDYSITIADLLPFPDEQEDLTVAEVIEKMRRFDPGTILHCIYSAERNLFTIEPCAALAVKWVDVQLDSVQATVVEDGYQQIPGVKIYIERANLLNGDTVDNTIETQTAGDITGTGTVVQTIEMNGSKEVREGVDYKTVFFPLTNGDDDFLEQVLYDLKPSWFDFDHYTYSADSIDLGGYSFIYDGRFVLISGTIPDWLPSDTITWRNIILHYTAHRKSDGAESSKLFNAAVPFLKYADTYTRQVSFVEAESIGDIAGAIYSVQEIGSFAGEIEMITSPKRFDLSASRFPAQRSYEGRFFDEIIKPGHRINIANGRAEWAAMNGVVQETVVSLLERSFSITFGPPSHISVGDLVSILKINRDRQNPTRFVGA